VETVVTDLSWKRHFLKMRQLHEDKEEAGHTIEQLFADYPYLEHEDILQVLRYAAWRARPSLPAHATPPCVRVRSHQPVSS